MSDETLPAGWVEVLFEEILTNLANGTTAEQHKDPPGIPVSRIETISEAKINFGKVRYVRDASPELRERFFLQPGDILFSHINSDSHLGKCALFKGGRELLHGMNLLLMRMSAAALPEFIEQFLGYLRARGYFMQIAQHAVNQSSLNQKKINQIPIPLPPLAEQKRIVAKIEELFSELEAGEESLRVARRQLGVYRQSLLKQAFEGKLTQKWRTKNPAKLESPTQLLAHIQSARWSRHEQQLKKWESAIKDWEKSGSVDRRPNKPRKLEESAPLTDEELSDLPALPDCWKWVPPDTLVSHESYSLGIGPFGSNLKVSDYMESGVPLVFVKNITRNDFSLAPRFVSKAKAKELSAHTTIGGDLLITKMGDPPGDCAIYPLGSPEAVITADCLKFRLLAEYCERGFYSSFINSMVCRKQLGFITRGVAQKKISVERFKSIAVPLCSLPEQQEIVRVLDEQFEAIERNEREIDGALRSSEALRQAILKKAFTGRLVPQDPADEPASKLLARLRAARAEPIAYPELAPRELKVAESQRRKARPHPRMER